MFESVVIGTGQTKPALLYLNASEDGTTSERILFGGAREIRGNRCLLIQILEFNPFFLSLSLFILEL
jgi:hypothetical protein